MSFYSSFLDINSKMLETQNFLSYLVFSLIYLIIYSHHIQIINLNEFFSLIYDMNMIYDMKCE